MSISEFQACFSEHYQGRAPYLHIFTRAVCPSRDAAIRSGDRDELADALKKSNKKQHVSIAFKGGHQTEKVLQINQLAYHTDKPLCLIDCAQLSQTYIGETEKNIAKFIANVEDKDWLLFFDEADALFGKLSTKKNQQAQTQTTDFDRFVKYLSRYPGICVVNFSNPKVVAGLDTRFDYHIHFTH